MTAARFQQWVSCLHWLSLRQADSFLCTLFNRTPPPQRISFCRSCRINYWENYDARVQTIRVDTHYTATDIHRVTLYVCCDCGELDFFGFSFTREELEDAQ